MHDDEVIPPTEPRYWTRSASTTCARCHHPFTARVDADLENEIAAHQERCFRIGDAVMWRVGHRWHEGLITALSECDVEIRCERGYSRGYPFPMWFGHKNIRRIPRPGQEVSPRCCGQPMIAAKLRDDWHCHTGEISHYRTQIEIEAGRDMQRAAAEQGRQLAAKARAFNEARLKHLAAPIEPTLYDGLTAEQCYLKWARRMPMGADQIAAAKRHYAETVGPEWSQRLRAKIAAKRKAERCAVQVEQDAEDFE